MITQEKATRIARKFLSPAFALASCAEVGDEWWFGYVRRDGAPMASAAVVSVGKGSGRARGKSLGQGRERERAAWDAARKVEVADG